MRVLAVMLLAAAVLLPIRATAHDASTDEPPRADIYDESAEASAVIDAAVRRAKKDNQRVLVQWGANWCGWCHLLHEHFATQREVARKLLYEYEVVLVDIGRFDRNMDLAARYGADLREAGVPYLTVLDGAGAVVANQATGPLEARIDGKPGHDPQRVLSFLAEHEAKPLVAEDVLAAGRRRAEREDKLVFLHFGAPWCGWCRRLETWLETEPVSKVFGRQFVDVKVDTDRMVGGQQMLTSMTKGVASGIPWFAILAPDGRVMATSFVEGDRNLGCPWTDEEIAAFRGLLVKVASALSEAEIDTILSHLGPRAASPPAPAAGTSGSP